MWFLSPMGFGAAPEMAGRTDGGGREETMGGETPRTDIDRFLGYLQVQRDHVLGTLDGLTEEETHRALLPSGWTLLGLV